MSFSEQQDGPSRRQLIQWPLAVAAGAALGSEAVAQAGGPPRLALLIGNRVYPTPFDLPPTHKNVHDLRDVLQRRGFEVTDVLDADVAQTRQALEAFSRKVQAAPPDAVVFFYFTGHGLQVDAENLLVAAGVNPSAKSEVLVQGSTVLSGDVVRHLPKRPTGLTMAVVDACRTSIRAAVAAGDGLNQVEAPPGCLIVFSTGAGKPAIAPAVETVNTFYTASLVKLMRTADDDLSFSDLFRLVKLDVQQTMQNHPLEAIRRLAQSPFIAENTQVTVPLSPRKADDGAPASRFKSADEEADWRRLQETIWPPDIVRQADAYLEHYPRSKLVASAQVVRQGASDAATILQRNDIRLYRRSFEAGSDLGAAYRADLVKAAHGDKDAAARIGRQWRTDATSGPEVSRYEGWMQFAAELGNGIASYELALHYRRTDQPQPAARWEARARELGYTPPPTLDHYRK